MTEWGTEGVLRQVADGMRKAGSRGKFKNVDPAELAAMDNKALAAWQSQYDSDSPQFLLATYEWQRRLTVQQVKAMRFAAYVSLAGVALGALLTFALTSIPSPAAPAQPVPQACYCQCNPIAKGEDNGDVAQPETATGRRVAPHPKVERDNGQRRQQ